MKLSCLRNKLISALGLTSRIVGLKTSLPILSNILISTHQGRLKISATDLELGINTWMGAKIEKDGAITIPTRLFSEFLASIHEEKVNLETADKQIKITSSKNQSLIKGMDANDFPVIPEIKKPLAIFNLDSRKLKKALEKTIFSSAIDEAKPALTGIFFKINPKEIILAATDSYRLAEKRIKTNNKISKELSFILPRRTANELIRIIGENKDEIKIKISDNQISFELVETYFISRLVEGNFPDYEQIIPKDFKTTVVLNQEEFSQNLKTASLFSRESANNVKILVKDKKIEINASSAQLGENQSQLTTTKKTGENIEFSINAFFLLEALNIIKEPEVELKLVDKYSPIVLKPHKDTSYFFIIMPLKQE